MRVNHLDDCRRRLNDLNHFVGNCNFFRTVVKHLDFSSYDVQQKSIPDSVSPIVFVLLPVDIQVIDLEFQFSDSMEPKFHIDVICRNALKIVGFVMRSTKEFSLSITIKTL